jgi:hypothetical protein
LIHCAKFVLSYNLILDFPSVTRVHMLIPMLSMSLSLSQVIRVYQSASVGSFGMKKES